MRQHLRNSIFSLKVNLGFASRLVIVSSYYCVIFVYAVEHLLRGDVKTFRADLGMFAEIFRLRKEIGIARRNVRRRVSDFKMFRQMLRLPSLSYLWRTVRGNV